MREGSERGRTRPPRGPAGRRSVAVAVLLFLLVAALGACSGGSDAAPTTSTTAGRGPTSTPAPSTATTSPTRPTPDGSASGRVTTVDGELRTPDGRERSYRVVAPDGDDYGDAALPLLLAFHGGLGSGRQFERASGFDALARRGEAVVVYPDGVAGPRGRGRTWNAGTCCGYAAAARVDDVGFVRRLVAAVASTHRIDPDRVYAAGHSNGAILSYRLACELSDVVVAIGVQAGTLGVPACHPARPVSVLHIHGRDDRNLPLAGGVGPDSISGVDFRPPLDAAGAVAAGIGCPARPAESRDASNPAVAVTTWAPCRDGTEVRFLTVTGAGHSWMGGPDGSAANRPGAAVRAPVDSSALIRAFLEDHARA